MSAEGSLPKPTCEREDAHPRFVAAIAGSMAVIVAIGMGVGLLLVRPSSGNGPGLPGKDGIFQNGPSETTDVETAWASVDHPPAAHADGYAWIDRRRGVVQVPIDRAIDLLCAEQAKAAPAPQPGTSSP